MSVVRMCSACRVVKDRTKLIRVVKQKNNIFEVDKSGYMDGRGAYICKNAACIAKCIKTKALNRSYKSSVPQAVYDALSAITTE